MPMKFTVVIPARLASTRLPNKPLLQVNDRPMVVQVAQQVLSGFSLPDAPHVVVAADDMTIVQACRDYGIEAVLTDSHHTSGSDRLAQACDILGLKDEDVVVNVQGDEPLINPHLIQVVADCLASNPQSAISTAAHPITDLHDFLNPNVVKVVLNAAGQALYFSRAPIPWKRDQFPSLVAQSLGTAHWPALVSPTPLRHIGIYGYRAHFLAKFPHLSVSPLEQQESLEQLRALWHGYAIAVHICEQAPEAGVDTPEDLARVRAYFANRSHLKHAT